MVPYHFWGGLIDEPGLTLLGCACSLVHGYLGFKIVGEPYLTRFI